MRVLMNGEVVDVPTRLAHCYMTWCNLFRAKHRRMPDKKDIVTAVNDKTFLNIRGSGRLTLIQLRKVLGLPDIHIGKA